MEIQGLSLKRPVFAPEGGTATMFEFGGGEETPPAPPAGGTETPPADGAPDWLMSKYHVKTDDGGIDVAKSMEKQAQGYRDLFASYSKKTDDLKKDVMEQVRADYAKELGVPDDPSAYEYPEGFDAPAEEVDKAFKEWAKKNNVAPDAFKDLVQNVYGMTQVNMETELAKLGKTQDEAIARIRQVNKWANAEFTEDDHGMLASIMRTADGVAFMERLMQRSKPNVFQESGVTHNEPALTRAYIRQQQADPRYGTDEAYTAHVKGLWAKFAAMPAHKQV